QAFRKSKSLAEGQADVYNNNSVLRYLSSTYYNDAMAVAASFDLTHELEADGMMEKHEALCSAIGIEANSRGNLFIQKAARYYQLWQQDVCDISLNEKSSACYELALESNVNDCDTYYNAAIVRYSLAQKIIVGTECFANHNHVAVIESALKLL